MRAGDDLGLGGTELGSDDARATLGALLKTSESMRRLGMLAGRMRRLAMNKRRSRTKHAASELSDITTGNDLARVLPHELMKLTDPLLNLDFMRAFVERSLLQYELTGSEREALEAAQVEPCVTGACSSRRHRRRVQELDLELVGGHGEHGGRP